MLGCALSLAQRGARAKDNERPFGDVQVLAQVPYPGLPEGIAVNSLPLANAPTAGDLQPFHRYNSEAPDGIAFGKSGKLYVMLAAPGNSGIPILGPDGTEITQLHNAPGSPF
jgi:sugar lactone lactonase YvrE